MTLTTNDMARELGISRQRVLKLAESYGLGTKIGRDWSFTDQDLDALKTRKDRRYKMSVTITTDQARRLLELIEWFKANMRDRGDLPAVNGYNDVEDALSEAIRDTE